MGLWIAIGAIAAFVLGWVLRSTPQESERTQRVLWELATEMFYLGYMWGRENRLVSLTSLHDTPGIEVRTPYGRRIYTPPLNLQDPTWPAKFAASLREYVEGAN